jgi:hypothetical protein
MYTLARWLVPWLCTLLVSAAIASAADLALSDAYARLPQPPASRIAGLAEDPVATRDVQIIFDYPDGTKERLTCSTRADLVSYDSIEVSGSDPTVTDLMLGACITPPKNVGRVGHPS